MTSSLKTNKSQTSECFIAIFGILLLFFGIIWVSGNMAGLNLMEHFPSFSWELVNAEELRRVIPF
ncbi:hypothetical protein [Halobacillus sp. Marseille-Q1614]|uniref:hypothetical protein n=1 Tax=Halobacillus sp. Marseille-Q1614 TaxID=2709134 RepID=UPI001570743E|nr:hypothetical protein [Halobacillus sp. Marseille-Q1614]